VAAAESREARQRAQMRERKRDERRGGARTHRLGWFSSAEIAAQPVISGD
jgi:hypothetical protein